MQNNSKKWLIPIVALLIINALAWIKPYKWDLTEDKKYTLAPSSVQLLQNLKNKIEIEVFLTGNDLTGGFKRLEKSLEQTLQDIKDVAGNKVIYKFTNINDKFVTEEEKNEFISYLAQNNLPPTNVMNTEGGKKTQSLVWPGALIKQGDKKVVVQFLKGNNQGSPQEILNQSAEGLEFELLSAMKLVNLVEKKKLGFFLNYNTQPAANLKGLVEKLKAEYDLYPVDLTASPNLIGLDAFLFLQPNKPVLEADKYKIDQFLMNGGKGIFMLDAVKVDTLGLEGNFANIQTSNLEDMLFNYGVRINNNLVKDMQLSGAIPMATGNIGEKAQINLVPWPYFPLANPFGTHPIVKNLDAVFMQYASTIDTVKSQYITKIPLLQTSDYTQIINAPAAISFNMASKDFDAAKSSAGFRNLAYLLVGKFNSLYINKAESQNANFKKQSVNTSIVVVSDSHVAQNQLDIKTKRPMPLGFDVFSNHQFSNGDFIKNALDYMLNPTGLISARSKTIALRPLDKAEIIVQKTFWQGFNLGLPLFLLGILGLLYFTLHKRQFAA